LSKHEHSLIHMFSICFAILFVAFFTGCIGVSDTTSPVNSNPTSDKNGVSTTALKLAPKTTEKTDKGEATMKITSEAFEDGGRIPVKYANKGVAGGQNLSPPLHWEDIPADTKSLALSMIDVSANNWVHWMVVNIPASTNSLIEGASLTKMPSNSIELKNTFGSKMYGGPQPPSGSGDHVYVTTIYALNTDKINMPDKPTASEFGSVLQGRILGQASIKGIFKR
jgi:Raf kinase inhibitor-like YbhB/YbcL family protein